MSDKKQYINAINNIIMHLQNHKHIALKHPKLDVNSFKTISYSDSSFETNNDHKSQIGYFIFLADKDNSCQPIN